MISRSRKLKLKCIGYVCISVCIANSITSCCHGLRFRRLFATRSPILIGRECVRACVHASSFGAYRCIVSASMHVEAAQTNKKSRTARGIRKVATDGSSLKLVGAEVVSQPPTISQCLRVLLLVAAHCTLNVVFTRNLWPRCNRGIQYRF